MTHNLTAQFLVFLVACPRIFALVAFAPGLDASFVPPMVRASIAGALAVLLSPLVQVSAEHVLGLTLQAYLVLLLSELVLGAVMGYLLSCLLEATRLAGEMVDLQIGFRAGSLYDPVTSTSSSLLGRLWFLTAVLFFFVISGHHWLFRGLMSSFELCPVGTLVYDKQIASVALEVVSSLFVLGLQLAAPLVAALVLADLAMGLVGRAMPQMNLMLVGMPAKIMVGLAALASCSPMMANTLTLLVDSLQRYLLLALRNVGA